MTRSLLIFTCLCVSFTQEVLSTFDCVQPPLECPNVNVTFFLITRSNADNPHQLLVSDPASLSSAPFVKGAQFKIIIHGYMEDNTTSPSQELIPEYMKCCDHNLITVNMGPLVKGPCYVQAAANTALGGKCTAQLIDALVDFGFALSLFHIIGFSLGAQVAGRSANYLTSGLLERITALDAALPLFVSLNNSMKIDPSDAKVVDACHTTSGTLGQAQRVGDVDFYANGGVEQPGCVKLNETLPGCSHLRAPALFAESINTKVGFYGYSCPSLSTLPLCKPNTANQLLFGEYMPLNASGLYFFNTNSAPPYAQGPLTN